MTGKRKRRLRRLVNRNARTWALWARLPTHMLREVMRRRCGIADDVALCAKPGCTWEAMFFGAWCAFHCPFDEAVAAQGKPRMGQPLPPLRNPFGGRAAW